MRHIRYIENEGALFRGVTRGYPEEVYDFKTKAWFPYKGAVPKPVNWGEYMSDAEAEAWIAGQR
jgi:hypothetical protein